MTAPRDPRERLPPFLAALLPDPETAKQQFRLWADKVVSFLHLWLTRFGNACARGWSALSDARWDRTATGRPCARGWSVLTRPNTLFAVCGAFAAVVLLVLAIAGKGDGRKTASPDSETWPTAETTAGDASLRQLHCDRLAIGDMGTVACAYGEILKIIDDRTCIVVPYALVQWSTYGSRGEQTSLNIRYDPQLPILLKGWPTAGKVTGQKVDLSNVFRVTGTEDVKKPDGAAIRVHVLELMW